MGGREPSVRVRLWARLAVIVTLWTTPASAKLCGDDVGGQDVPCACGDVLVSSIVLGDDPVVTGPPCPHDGLLVRAPDARRGLAIDLHGTTLRGTGGGVGIRVLAGGPGGAQITSSTGPATITGFADGIVARGTDTLALVQDVVMTDNHRDGVRVSGPDFTIRRVQVRAAKRDGFVLGGSGFQITDTSAIDSGRYGYLVMGNTGQIGLPGAGNRAERSGDIGFSIMGAGHTVAECMAVEGHKAGVHLQAAQLDVRGCRATDNAGNGIEGLGNHWQMEGNQALRNIGDGITVRGVGLVDAGGNRGVDNQGQQRARGAVQCAISGTPCAF